MATGRTRDAWLLAAGVAVLSSGSIFALLAGQPPLLTAFLRTLLASLPLVLLAAQRHELKGMPRREVLLAIASGVLLAIHLSSWFASMGMVSVAVSLVLLSTAPLWSMLIGALLGLESFRIQQAIAVVISLGGIGLIAWSAEGASSSLWGGALALLSGLTMAGYTLCARARSQEKSIIGFAAYSYLSAAGFLLFVSLGFGSLRVPDPPSSLLWILAMTVCSQLIGHTTVNWAAGRLGAVTVGQVLLLEPIIASLLAWAVFGQAVTLLQGLGGAVVLVGASLSISSLRAARYDEAQAG